MATLIGDYGSNHSSGFHTMIATSGLPYPSHSEPSHYRSTSKPRDAPSRQHPSSQPRSSSNYCTENSNKEWPDQATGTGASRFPSPPDSSSPGSTSASRSDDNLQAKARPQHGQTQEYMEDSTRSPAQDKSATVASSSTSVLASTQSITPNAASRTSTQPAIPSPAESIRLWIPSQVHSEKDLIAKPQQPQTTVNIRDLAHIQSLARADQISGNDGILRNPPLPTVKYEISGMPIGDIIEMVAALLTKITTTNDLQHDALSRNAIERNASHVKQAQAQNEGSASEHNMSPMSSSVLAFHGKNVPAITILSYLSRIHKYCPTTFEVFLSLLVYFDRMTERVNDIVMKAEEAKKLGKQPEPVHRADVVMRDDGDDGGDSDSAESDEDLADDDEDDEPERGRSGKAPEAEVAGSAPASGSGSGSNPASVAAASQPTFFVVDSFNIHRLIIAGVTCASKFFSDVFYTNSRYAKVRFFFLIFFPLGFCSLHSRPMSQLRPWLSSVVSAPNSLCI